MLFTLKSSLTKSTGSRTIYSSSIVDNGDGTIVYDCMGFLKLYEHGIYMLHFIDGLFISIDFNLSSY